MTKEVGVKQLLNVSLLLALVINSFIFSQGSLISDKFFSTSLDTIKNVNVYLPENYDSTDITKDYPVIYFLHGSGGNHTSYSGIYPILDSLITNMIIKPVIVVVPDGSSGPYLGSQYSNSALYGLFEDYIVIDVINYIDGNYKTIPSKDNRAIMGHSMGGEGSMRIALKNPNLYTAVASHAGILTNRFIEFIGPIVLSEIDSTNQIKPTNGYWSQALFTAAGGYTPNMNNPPYYVDLPIDNNGNLIDSTWAKWQDGSTVDLATEYNPESNLYIYFDCGTKDFVFPYTEIFADTLKSLNVPFEFQTFDGGHSDKFYDRFKISVVFLDSVINNNTERIKEVKLALDRYLGAEIIGAEADKAFIEKDYFLVKQKLELLFAKYPEFARNGEYKTLIKTIEQIELDKLKREEAEKKEQYRLANINNLGMWSIHHPVNKFGESTNNRYITNTRLTHGTFSNSETKDSKLNVKFLISDSSNISIQLFENAGNMPLKAWSDHSYIVFVQDNDGNSYKITAVNKSDRLEFNKNASIQLHNTLLKGGNVKIKIHEYYNSGNNYQFSIQKADWYENAYRNLTIP